MRTSATRRIVNETNGLSNVHNHVCLSTANSGYSFLDFIMPMLTHYNIAILPPFITVCSGALETITQAVHQVVFECSVLVKLLSRN